MSEFTENLDDMLHLTKQKHALVSHLIKNYRINIHYIIDTKFKKIIQRGGHNKVVYMLTTAAAELLKNTYNLRNKYIVNVSDNVKQVNIGMCIENQTIGFIANAYSKILNVKRQYIINKYRLDLYFIDRKLIIECDENNHTDRDAEYEKTREEYLISLGNKLIRYNPNVPGFDLSNVLRDINEVLFSS